LKNLVVIHRYSTTINEQIKKINRRKTTKFDFFRFFLEDEIARSGMLKILLNILFCRKLKVLEHFALFFSNYL